MTSVDVAERFAMAGSDTDVRDYAVFGGVLRSAVSLPELPVMEGAPPDWTLRTSTSAPLATAAKLLGQRRAGSETYRLSSIPDGLRLEYSHAGTFDVATSGSEIIWYPSETPDVELVRAIILGPVLALALEAGGSFCLHGSAVAFGERAVGFIAPKHHGKSTLAVALAAAGARFVGDDTLAISPGVPPALRPGIGSARLWEDAARELRVAEVCDSVITGAKSTASGFPGMPLRESRLALDAVYVLDPQVPTEGEPTVRRVRLSSGAAAVALAHHTKLPDSLVGLRAAGARLRTAVALASTVPVYSLEIARSFTHLPAAIEQLFAWHGEFVGDRGHR